MRTINEYINLNNSYVNDLIIEAVNDVKKGITLDEIYMSMFASMVCESEEEINEFLGFDKIGAFFQKMNKKGDDASTKVVKKIKDVKDAAVAKFEEWSDSAKKAYEEIKKKAGDAWETTKEIVTNVIGKIEAALKNVMKGLLSVIKVLALSPVIIMAAIVEVIVALIKGSAELATKIFEKSVGVIATALLIIGVYAAQKADLSADVINNITSSLSKT